MNINTDSSEYQKFEDEFSSVFTGFLEPSSIHRRTCRRGGRREPAPVGSLPRAGAHGLRRSVLGLRAAGGEPESVKRERGKGEGEAPAPRHPTRDPRRADPTINSLWKHQRRRQPQRKVTSRRRRRCRRARSRSRRLSAPGSRHDAKRASERNRLRRSRRRHRGRRRLRLPHDVSTSAHSPMVMILILF